MHYLTIAPQAHGTLVETLKDLVNTAGLVTTVQSTIGLTETVGAIVAAAPRLSEDHTVQANGLVVSQVGIYRMVWGVVRYPSGSLAVLTPMSSHEGQNHLDWISHYRTEVLDPVLALSGRGFRTGGGGSGSVTDLEFAQAFRNAYI